MKSVAVLLLAIMAACAAPVKQAWPEPVPAITVQTFDLPQLLSQEPEGEEAVQSVSHPPMLELKEFDKASVDGFLAKFKELDSKYNEIWIRIDSGGGSVFGGQELIHGLEAADAKVTCIVDWKAYSMAFFTLQSPGCDVRLMTKRSSLMAHEPSVQSGGKAGDLRDDADALDALNEGFIVTAAERMKMNPEVLRSKITRRNWWMSYKEAKKYHAVDGFIRPQDMPVPTAYEVKKSFLQLLLGE